MFSRIPQYHCGPVILLHILEVILLRYNWLCSCIYNWENHPVLSQKSRFSTKTQQIWVGIQRNHTRYLVLNPSIVHPDQSGILPQSPPGHFWDEPVFRGTVNILSSWKPCVLGLNWKTVWYNMISCLMLYEKCFTFRSLWLSGCTEWIVKSSWFCCYIFL